MNQPLQRIRLGSRKSKLALEQARLVQEKLLEGFDCELVTFETKGDIMQSQMLHQIGEKGLFTHELEMALRNGQIDLAVHSAKDLPVEMPPDLEIIALTEREDPRDAVIFAADFPADCTLAKLPPKARIGSSSLRRIAQLKYQYPNLDFISIRGNVETRLKKIKEGHDGLSAGILAFAGLKRLNLTPAIGQILELSECLPAPGQGSLAIQAHQSLQKQNFYQDLIAKLNHSDSYKAVQAERAALHAIGGGCQTPFGAYATIEKDVLKLKACLFFHDKFYQREISGEIEKYQAIGLMLGCNLKRLHERDNS